MPDRDSIEEALNRSEGRIGDVELKLRRYPYHQVQGGAAVHDLGKLLLEVLKSHQELIVLVEDSLDRRLREVE